MDGTLVATRRLYLEAFADALEPELGYRPTHDDLMARHPRAEVRFLRELAGLEAHPAVMERFYHSYETRHARDFEGIYTGVPEVLDSLRARGVPLGIVTGKSRRSWGITGPRVGLGPFPVTVFDDDVPRPKPDPAGLHLALEQLQAQVGDGRLPPEEVLYLGDSHTDLHAAQAAGLLPGGVLWSKRGHERAPLERDARSRGGFALPEPSDLLELLAESLSRGRHNE